ncbi:MULTISPECIES: DNA cytosine methyltransferase [Bacillus]|uniref:DNA cytosine methyltransferase n=1 Tax=Bacillus TaxID=1386 RepID=UPI00099CA1C7|nr:DNA (cytosine-5-)-methyltransferase [Bacillus cereus]NSL62063.1 DNA (cytosine-5-)-methyltransferase [Bacillus cereus]OPD43994.1 DNA (cytosine-5-)-methyltransferase [Bacillus cereus]
MQMLDLFSGIGGISLAADWAGIETVAFCEIEPFNQKVLNKHWPIVPIFSDIRKLTKRSLEERGVDVGTISIVAGGYPCQPFSVAGDRKGEEDDRHLWPEVFRLLQEIRPTWFIGENVAGHVTLGLDNVLTDLESIGYTSQPFVIPACAIGAPHRRERVFIISFLSNSNCIRYQGSQQLREDISKIEKWGKGSFGTTSKLFDDIDWEKRAFQSSFLGRGDGLPNRMDRIRSLGNAVVPQQIYPIFAAIAKIERGD